MASRQEDYRLGDTTLSTAGFTQSPTGYSVDGVPVNRAFARAHQAINRKADKKHKPDKWADARADGLTFIREFHARAGIRVVPYSEAEMREVLVAAKDEFDQDGMVHSDTYMHLNTVGYDADEVIKLWTLMAKAEVNIDTDTPINTFGDNEEPDNV